MRPVSRNLSLVFLTLIASSILALAQVRPTELTRDNRPRNCSISGRVTINGQPAANVQVQFIEFPADFNSPQPIRQTADGSITRNIHQIRTDGEGRYQINNLPPGRFGVTTGSRAFVAAVANPLRNEPKILSLDAGESRDNVDFALVRGGVITGQITDAEGRPVIAQSLRVFAVVTLPDGQTQFRDTPGDWVERMTDDRGIYRVFGLPPGSYVIGAGGEGSFFSRSKYPAIYYPEATDQRQAKPIPVKAGEEVTGINLRLGVSRKTYQAIGRVIEADNGKPVPNIRISCAQAPNQSETESEGGYGEGSTDRLGNFRLTSLKRGKYFCNLHAGWLETTEFYSEHTSFDIADGDISGVEIKALRGGSISGFSLIEGSSDPKVKSKLTQIMIYAQSEPENEQDRESQPSSHHQTQIKPDGTFLITGVAPGKVSLNAHNVGDRALSFLRLERGGAIIQESFPLAKGEKVTDLRLVFTVGTGVIRGQIQATSPQPPVSTPFRIQAKLHGNSTGAWFGNLVDDKGRFELSSLPNGEYELQLHGFSQLPNGDRRQVILAKQKVVVSAGAEVRVTIPYDPNRPVQEER